MTERGALLLTTRASDGSFVNGGAQHAAEVVDLLGRAGYAVERAVWPTALHPGVRYDLGVAVSYACAAAVAPLQRVADRTWLDAVDSWRLVNGSGLRAGRPSYAARALRDAVRLARMPAPDLVTWISASDRRHDGRTVRGRLRLVVPGAPAAAPRSLPGRGRRVVLAGDWSYAPNADGLRWFVERVLPLLERSVPDPDWHVAMFGTGPVPRLPPRVRVEGYTESPEALYRAGDVHVAPLRFGGGVKRKVLLPLLAGLPVVTTPTGANGLRAHDLLDVRTTALGQARATADRLRAADPVAPVALADLVDADDTAQVLDWLRA